MLFPAVSKLWSRNLGHTCRTYVLGILNDDEPRAVIKGLFDIVLAFRAPEAPSDRPSSKWSADFS